MTTTNNTTTTPVYEANQDLIDNAMLEMDKSTLLKNFGSIIKAELQKPEHAELLDQYRYRDLDSWECEEGIDDMRYSENVYIELNSRSFSLRSESDTRTANPKWESYPVYAYIHGGMTVSLDTFSCRWDSGQLGKIWAENREIAQSYIEWLDRYLNPHSIKFDVVNECYVDNDGKAL